ncbi:citrate synthase [Candidatus Pelagisphaera phototrophica]|uniref:citrate synthase n=1 Tax=Candidatus Pelagisphaera phototrophica TaxID=2684113 RepID=UPI0019E39B0A|nr:citrate synthase [Candidatus Pelagisphaera phototrophica]QXD31901.1 citrate synthase [Candidatus Pelagisphaera phototrophica]
MSKPAVLTLDDKEYVFPTIKGVENEKAVDFRTLRSATGYISYDEGYGNTGSCQSEITYIDGEVGILRYRGIPIEQLADKSSFLESSYMLLYGDLPTQFELDQFTTRVRKGAAVSPMMCDALKGFPRDAPPMGMLGSMLGAMSCYNASMATNDRAVDLEHFDEAAAAAIAQTATAAALGYRVTKGLEGNQPDPSLSFGDNFLHLMFSEEGRPYKAIPEVSRALDLMLLLHADHEQNCSTSTVRMVASGGANLFASVAAGCGALWGPAHGGANMAVIKMLEEIRATGDDGSKFIEEAKSGKSGKRLMGFGHRVYKNFDPRAKIIGKACEELLNKLGIDDPCLDIARHLEQAALADDYFISRNLYPNVDFYSGIVLRALGIPSDMFTVMFAIGRMPGWVANWREIAMNPKMKINRPRQIYQGPALRDYVAMEDRG